MEPTTKIPAKYPVAIRLLHWIMALLIISLLIMGLVMSGMERTDPNRAYLYNLHKSLGVTVLALAFLRLAIRLRSTLPPLPEMIPVIERKLAALGHLGLYVFMLAIPLSGIIMTNSYGFAVKWFDVELPRFVGANRDFGHLAGEAHEWLAYALIGLLLAHVVGALKHLIKERINLFKRLM